jgi:CRP/FNR family transcriptional regulator, dissimilatory nitrate respiration regulator
MNYSNIGLFKNIEGQELKDLLYCCEAMTSEYEKGEYIWHAADSAKKVGVVLSGQVNIIKEDILGNRNIIGKVGPGYIFGETFACAGISEYPVSVEVSTTSNIMLLNLARVIRQCSSACSYHTELIKNLLEIMAQKNLNLNHKISFLSKKTTKQKIAYLLLSSMKSEKDRFLMLDFSREEMADYLGINRSALSRELSWFKEKSIINYKRNKFEIKDIKALGNNA